MANFRYVTPNALRFRVVRQRRLVRVAGLPIVLGGQALHPLLGGLECRGGRGTLESWGRPLHGAVGEERALGYPAAYSGSLANLPAHYILFNILVVPTGHGGTRELDLVVLGRNGLFVVAVKHLRGEISGTESDRDWQPPKRSRCSGTAYTTWVRSPVAQVSSAAGVLHRHLASRGVNVWVQGISELRNDGIHVQPCRTANTTGKRLIVEWTPALCLSTDEVLAARPMDIAPGIFCTRRGTPYVREDGSATCMGHACGSDSWTACLPKRRSRIGLPSTTCARNVRPMPRVWSMPSRYWLMPTAARPDASTGGNRSA